VGSGSTGHVTVTTPGGTAASAGNFTYKPPDVEITTITLTDADLPAPPINGMVFHFVAPSTGDFGTAKIRLSYGLFGWAIWLGVENGQLWMYHLPKREDIPPSLQGFYDYVGINETTTYTPDGRYWLNAVPAWLNLAKYDPDLVGLPEFTDVRTTDGQMIISYKAQ